MKNYAQDSKISALTTQQKEAQNKLMRFKLKYAIQIGTKKLQAENENFKKSLQNLKVKSQSFQNIVVCNESLETARSAQTNGTATVTLIRLLTLTQSQKLFLV